MDFLLGHAKTSTIEKAADKAGLNFVDTSDKVGKDTNHAADSNEFSKEFQRVQTSGIGIAEAETKSGKLLPTANTLVENNQAGLEFSENLELISPLVDKRQFEWANQSSQIVSLGADGLSQSTTDFGPVAEMRISDGPAKPLFFPKETKVNQDAPVTSRSTQVLNESSQVLSESSLILSQSSQVFDGLSPSTADLNDITRKALSADGSSIAGPAPLSNNLGDVKLSTDEEINLPLDHLTANTLENGKGVQAIYGAEVKKDTQITNQLEAFIKGNNQPLTSKNATKMEASSQTSIATVSSSLSPTNSLTLNDALIGNRSESNSLVMKEAELLAKNLSIKPDASLDKKDIGKRVRPSEFNAMGVKLAKSAEIPANASLVDSIGSNIKNSLLNKALSENTTAVLVPTEPSTVRYASSNALDGNGFTIASDSVRAAEAKPSVVPATFEQALSLRGDFSPKLALRVQWLIKQAVSSAEIMMDPPELGPLSVKMKSIGNETHIMFSVSNPQTKETVEANINRLREMLLEQGINLGDTEVQQQDKDEQEPKTASQPDSANADVAAEEQLVQEVKVGLLDTYI